ncbi:MAG: hypothetical protein L3J43_11195, partial [Sulfurovum sp.]|nr:hypothetical protein [Sulfurovum sp.]
MKDKIVLALKDTDNLLSYLVIGLAFSLPVSVALTNSILVLLILVFLYEREYKKRFEVIKNNSLVYILLLFVLMHVVGCLWSDNLDAAV